MAHEKQYRGWCCLWRRSSRLCSLDARELIVYFDGYQSIIEVGAGGMYVGALKRAIKFRRGAMQG